MAIPTLGRLGAAALSANTDNVVYTVPTGIAVATVNINVVSLDTAATTIRLAIATSSTPTAADWLNYDFPLSAKGSLERTGIVMSSGEKVIIRTASSLITARVHGFEEV